ncbi:hypothetical protein MLD38_007595 [Melastoma candidum]|uniref:Uncharacterized protein n=1 Tax=Melastoma candidum TaxID=119954 RepID=A0ACB9RS67_9MYRT|nr:hypothetical protein MLD38_007595 [Melastoma candidum]
MANNGQDLWELTSRNPEFGKTFNEGMACTAKISIKAIIEERKHVFESISSLVDVGGGNGSALVEIVKACPHLKGINLDLPHVVATAKEHDRISHVGGDFFEAVPAADAVFMKRILHDWDDEDCMKILKNCREAIPEDNGKVILSEIVLDPEGDGLFDEMGVVMDLVMMVVTNAKERTESEWRLLLERGGFPRCNVFKIPGLLSIIEGYPI